MSLGAVVLAVTGCEALYADMGHFGSKPIQYAWLFVALPALMLNYFGQGAALLRDPEQAGIAFFSVDAALGAYADGAAGDPGRHHRQPGGDHRRLLHDPAGGAAGPVAAHGNPPHLAPPITARSMCRA